MKVLHVTTHMNIGGIANYVLSLSRALKLKGVQVSVASSGGELESELQNSGIKHMQLDIKTKFEFHPKVLAAAFRLRKIIREEGIDIIHAHTRASQVASLIASRMARMGYVTTCHGYFKVRSRRIFDTWGDRVIAISQAVAEHLTRDFGVSPKRIALIYSGIDVERFSKVFSESEIAWVKKAVGLKDGPVIGAIGRLSGVKGHKFLITAMADIVSKRRDAQALIVGDGPERDALKNLAGSLNLSDAVVFAGSAMDTRIPLSLMDIFVFPSVKEGLGIALLEALGAGKACVASRIGGIENIIQDGSNGILVDAGSPKAIADAVIRLLNDRNLGKSMGEKGRSLIRDKFSLGFMAERMIKLYEEVVKR